MSVHNTFTAEITMSATTPHATEDEPRGDFLDRFSGVHVVQTVQFAHPLVLRYFKRTFAITARNYYFVTVLAPTRYRHRGMPLADTAQAIDAKLSTAITATEQALIRFQTVVAPAVSAYANGESIPVKLITPLSSKHLELLCKSDQLLRLLETGWISHAISGTERARIEAEVKRRLDTVALLAREACVKLMRDEAGSARSAMSARETAQKRITRTL